MNALFIVVLSFAGYWLAYGLYGKFVSRRIFGVDSEARVPSKVLEDGMDYVPTRKGIVFGHHFTSIAGTGPIVGPAIGVIWGWVPAMIWIFFGSIFVGAVHDFSALVISLRHQGKSITEISAEYVSERVRRLFFVIVCLALLIVVAIFGLVIAIIFDIFPTAVFPVWMQIPIALGLGFFGFKRQLSLMRVTAVAVGLMYLSILFAMFLPISIPAVFGIPSTGVWTILLLMYAFVASVLPVGTLLQPRDYINSWQLFIVLGVILLGVLVSGFQGNLSVVAPAVNLTPVGAPAIFPFLFITVACGAVSGFHCMVSSGTTSKQLASEMDARPVAFGGMMMEAALATLVVVSVVAGIAMVDGAGVWDGYYSSWMAMAGLGSKLSAVVNGAGNIIASVGIHREFAVVLMGVFIASFAGTTLDTSTRIQRYVISELFSGMGWRWPKSKMITTAVAVLSAGALAFSSGFDGTGALLLWPLFGAVNQLLAALALIVATVYLRKRGGGKFWVTLLPCLFMLGMTLWAGILNQAGFFETGKWLLFGINGVVLGLTVCIVFEAGLVFFGRRI